MKISIVMSAYNVGRFIRKAITSVFCQTVDAELELIVVDDASTDATKAVVHSIMAEHPEYDIHLIEHATNMGAGVSRRDGIKFASGDYIATIDSDDFIEPDHFKLLLDEAIRTDADIVAGGIKILNEKGERIDRLTFGNYIGNGVDILKKYLGTRTMFMNNMLIRSSHMITVPYSTRRYVEDTPTLVKLLYTANRVAYIDVATYNYIQHGSSLCNSASKFKTHLFCGLCTLDLIRYFRDHDCESVISEIGLYEILSEYMMNLYDDTIRQEDAKAYINEWAEFTMRSQQYIRITETETKQ